MPEVAVCTLRSFHLHVAMPSSSIATPLPLFYSEPRPDNGASECRTGLSLLPSQADERLCALPPCFAWDQELPACFSA